MACAMQHVEQQVSGLIQIYFAAQDAGDVHIDMFTHGAHGAGVGRKFDDRQNGIADNVTLARGKEVGHKTGGSRQSDHFSRSG